MLALLATHVAYAQAPVLTNLSPVRNALAVPTTSPVVLTFSQALDSASASGASISVYSHQRGGLLTRAGGGGSFSGGGTNTISFAPAAGFQPGEVLNVTVTRGAVGLSGDTLVAPHVYQFTAATTPGSGGGTFGGGYEVTTDMLPYGVALADIDGDGDVDLLVATGADSVNVRLNDGSGHFTRGDDSTVVSSAYAIAAGDMDGDGDLDRMVARGGIGALRLQLNDGTGHFSDQGLYALDEYVTSVIPVDLDGNGTLDIVAANNNPNHSSGVWAGLNDGTGVFQATPHIQAISRAMYVLPADIDNDGDVDLLAAHNDWNYLTVAHNDGHLNFTAMALIQVGNGPRSLATADIDADGDLDLLAALDGCGAVLVLRNNGAGVFSRTDSLVVGSMPFCLTMGDLDGDGDADLLTTRLVTPGQVAVHLNDGTGSFTAAASVTVGAEPYTAAVADIDGDGDLDLLTANRMDGTVSVRLNQSVVTGLPARRGTDLTLAPNPATHTVRLTGAPAGPGYLLDVLARPIRTFTSAGGQSETILDLTGISSGIYTVRAGALIRKLIVD